MSPASIYRRDFSFSPEAVWPETLVEKTDSDVQIYDKLTAHVSEWPMPLGGSIRGSLLEDQPWWSRAKKMKKKKKKKKNN